MQKPPGLRLDLLGEIGSFSARRFKKPIQNIVADLVSYRKEAVMKLNNNFSFSCFSLFFFWIGTPSMGIWNYNTFMLYYIISYFHEGNCSTINSRFEDKFKWFQNLITTNFQQINTDHGKAKGFILVTIFDSIYNAIFSWGNCWKNICFWKELVRILLLFVTNLHRLAQTLLKVWDLAKIYNITVVMVNWWNTKYSFVI